MKKMLVTVITPTYNRAELLEETIKSVLEQDYPNIEYIVLDDGSTDNTKDIVKKFKNKIIFKSHKNIGEVKTVNKGFKLARGEIIGVVNSDDPLLPGAIKEIIEFMKKNPDVIVAYPDWIKIDEKGRVIEKVTTPDYNFEYMIKSHDNITGPGTFFRRKILRELKGRDTKFKYVSDYDFWLRAGLIGEFARIPKVLATSRVHKDQATLKDKGFTMAMEHIWVLNKFFSLPNVQPSIIKLKAQAYEKALEAARICRGDKLVTKFIVFFVCLYYSPIKYLRTFFKFRINMLKGFIQKI